MSGNQGETCVSTLGQIAIWGLIWGLGGCADDGPREGDTGLTGLSTTSATDTDDGTASDTTGEDPTTGDTDDAPQCDEDCEGECIDGVCCDVAKACDDVCCGGDEVCSFGACVLPGAECIDATECSADEYCEYSLGEPADDGGGGMCPGGASLATGRCLPAPPECPPGVEPAEGDDIDCLPVCEVIPDTSFNPVLKYEWTGADSMMAPIVVQLDDDNCDQTVNERDIPEIVFATFVEGDYNNNGTLRAISIVDGAIVDKWSVAPTTDPDAPGPIDRRRQHRRHRRQRGRDLYRDRAGVRAFDHDGTELWTSAYVGRLLHAEYRRPRPRRRARGDRPGRGPRRAQPEMTEATFAGQFSVFASDDIDGDGLLEVVGPRYVFDADGTQVADVGIDGEHAAGRPTSTVTGRRRSR